MEFQYARTPEGWRWRLVDDDGAVVPGTTSRPYSCACDVKDQIRLFQTRRPEVEMRMVSGEGWSRE